MVLNLNSHTIGSTELHMEEMDPKSESAAYQQLEASLSG